MIAKETTLGADDGIGVAATLALLASDLNTGKVEGLFTISEETGMANMAIPTPNHPICVKLIIAEER